MLQVSEIFGPTIQGEGRSIGMPTMFLRVGGNPETGAPGCNLHCVWCDTAYTWRYTPQFPHRDGIVYDPAIQNKLMSVEDVRKKIIEKSSGVKSLVISGGEPLLFQRQLIPLMAELTDGDGFWIEVETAGTIEPMSQFLDYCDQLNVSPKLENSGNPLSLRYRHKVLRAISETGVAIWKFVVSDIKDFDEIDTLVGAFNMEPVYIMPEGINERALSEHTFIDEIIKRGYYLTPRLHIQLWGNERGR